MVNCPDVQIPVETSTTMRTTTMLPPTGRPGDTGATGQKVTYVCQIYFGTSSDGLMSFWFPATYGK